MRAHPVLPWRPVAAILALSIAAGAMLAWRRAAASRAKPPRAETAFAVPVLVRRAPKVARGTDAGRRAAPRRAPRPLSDADFDDARAAAGHAGPAVFTRIHGPLSEPRVVLRALNQPEGSFLFNAETGWLKFDGHGWVQLPALDVPERILRLWPEPPSRAMRFSERVTRDGVEEAR